MHFAMMNLKSEQDHDKKAMEKQPVQQQ